MGTIHSSSEDELYGIERETGTASGFVVFRLSDEWYGVDMSHVREIIRMPPVSVVPHVPDHIVGIANLRGAIISITNLNAMLGVSNENERKSTTVIILGDDLLTTGILVDGSEQAIQIQAEAIQKLAPADAARKPLVDGLVSLKDRLVAILNVDRILSSTRLKPSGNQTQGEFSHV